MVIIDVGQLKHSCFTLSSPIIFNKMHYIIVFVLLIGGCLPLHATSTPLLHTVQLDEEGKYVFSWTPLEDNIILQVECETHGYVGLGFSTNGAMRGSDIIIGWVDQDGSAQISDRHGVGNTLPVEDQSQDVTLQFGRKNSTHTILRFSRPWSNCDENDFQLSRDTLKIIWAYSTATPVNEASLQYHTKRGAKSMYLKEPPIDQFPDINDPETKYFDLRAPNITLPDDLDTFYWCWIDKVPSDVFDAKHQFIGYQPLIKKENLPYFHHIIVYECHIHDSDLFFEKWSMHSGIQCFSPDMPPSFGMCESKNILTWAVGSNGEMLPKHTGFALGEKYGGSNYFMMQAHYDNPHKHKGVIDNSGVRLYYTNKVRENDVGIMMIGHTVNGFMTIPPNQPSWDIIGHCTSDCTEKIIPRTGVKLIGGVLHGHLLATSIDVKQIRKGKVIDTPLKDHAYDFNYQQSRFLKEELTILPGDHFIVTCKYNSSHKDIPTFSGEGTREEMCLAFLMYYPSLPLDECESSIHTDDYLQALQLKLTNENEFREMAITGEPDTPTLEEDWRIYNERLTYTPGQVSKNFSFSDILYGYQVARPRDLAGDNLHSTLHKKSFWEDEQKLKDYQEALITGSYTPQCLVHRRNIVKKTKYNYPRFVEKPEPKKCIPESTNKMTTQTKKKIGRPIEKVLEVENEHRFQIKNSNFQETNSIEPEKTTPITSTDILSINELGEEHTTHCHHHSSSDTTLLDSSTESSDVNEAITNTQSTSTNPVPISLNEHTFSTIGSAAVTEVSKEIDTTIAEDNPNYYEHLNEHISTHTEEIEFKPITNNPDRISTNKQDDSQTKIPDATTQKNTETNPEAFSYGVENSSSMMHTLNLFVLLIIAAMLIN